jgi:replication-associated recombination protein RarA
MKLPSLYKPSSPKEIIGSAGQIAAELKRAIKDALDNNNAPLKVIFAGDAGVGKSTLAEFVIQALGVTSKWAIRKFSGVDVDIEKVREIAADLHYKDLFGSYRVVWVEEADSIPPAAQTRFLLLMDDLPQGCAIVCTTNRKAEDFRNRFQTRFKYYEVDGPQPHEIQALLAKFGLAKRDCIQIATFACGNVRAALLDAERLLQAAA